jgi:hypothetical protein
MPAGNRSDPGATPLKLGHGGTSNVGSPRVARSASTGKHRLPALAQIDVDIGGPQCALVVWRQLIDDACRNPREELTFQASLADYSHILRQEGGSVTDAWMPGAPPDGWVY